MTLKTVTLEQIQEEINNGTYNLTKNGKCTGCGSCCSNLLTMTNKEVETIRKYIKNHNIKEHKKVFPLAEPSLDLTCPFLNDSKPNEKCEIYEVRPRICRDFICDVKQRKPIDVVHVMKCRIVNVREEFFGK